MDQAISYPGWQEAEQAYAAMRRERERVWYDPGLRSNLYGWSKSVYRDGIWNSLRDRFFPQNSGVGKWGSKAVAPYCHL